jgi:hypothetical protein
VQMDEETKEIYLVPTQTLWCHGLWLCARWSREVWSPAVWSHPKWNVTLVPCSMVAPKELYRLISSEVLVWLHHLCLVAPLPMIRAYDKLSKFGLRFALAALVSELSASKV